MRISQKGRGAISFRLDDPHVASFRGAAKVYPAIVARNGESISNARANGQLQRPLFASYAVHDKKTFIRSKDDALIIAKPERRGSKSSQLPELPRVQEVFEDSDRFAIRAKLRPYKFHAVRGPRFYNIRGCAVLWRGERLARLRCQRIVHRERPCISTHHREPYAAAAGAPNGCDRVSFYMGKFSQIGAIRANCPNLVIPGAGAGLLVALKGDPLAVGRPAWLGVFGRLIPIVGNLTRRAGAIDRSDRELVRPLSTRNEYYGTAIGRHVGH